MPYRLPDNTEISPDRPFDLYSANLDDVIQHPPPRLMSEERRTALGLTWVAPPPPPPQPPPSIQDVKNAAQQRIITLTGAGDLMSCIIKQSNANMRANELNEVRHDRAWTPEEEAEVAALKALATGVKHIRSKSNEIEAMDPIPNDFATNDSYWT